MRPLLPFLVLAAGILACDRRAASDSAPPRDRAEVFVDSALPVDTLLARFRAATADTPSALVGGESSPERLTRAFLAALERHDTTTIRRLAMTRGEFAWLYYPHTKFTAPPYELGPDLLWLQLGAASEKGIVRLLRRYGGSRLRFESLACPDSAAIEGPNRVTVGCRVRFAAADSAARTLRIFGSLLERDGRYKFVSYANEL